MRVYVADARARAFQETMEHVLMAWVLVLGLIYDASFFVAVGVGWHLRMAWSRWRRSRELKKVASGYVEVTPGITVVTLNPDRARRYEVDPHFRN